METQILDLGFQLLQELGITKLYALQERFEIHYEFDNQAIIAFGKTPNEVIENFYHLYQEYTHPE